MLKGNTCISSESFSWKRVDQVIIADNQYNWMEHTFEKFNVSFSGTSFSIGRYGHLPATSITCDRITSNGIENFSNKGYELLRLFAVLNTTYSDLTQFQRVGSDQTSDSGSESIPDSPIPPAFTDDEWNGIKQLFFGRGGVKELYDKACEQSFDNHVGKVFLASFIKLCCVMMPDSEKFVNSSTCSSGEQQPGCSNFTSKVIRSTPSSSRSTPMPGEQEGTTTLSHSSTFSRYADVSYWDEQKQMYPITVEVKSADEQASEEQCIEQMFGLFRSWQKAMLGIVVKPGVVGVKIMKMNDGEVEMHDMVNDMPLKEAGTFKNLARLFIAFIYFVV